MPAASAQDGLDNLREFVRAGGTLVALNRTAGALIPLLSLPVENVIEGAKSSKFFCSGALVRVNTEHAGPARQLRRAGFAGGDVPERPGV